MNDYRFILIDYLSNESNTDVNHVIKSLFVNVLYLLINPRHFIHIYNNEVNKARTHVLKGVKLNEINPMFLTKQVCYDAVKYERNKGYIKSQNINHVPCGQLIVIMKQLDKQSHQYYANQCYTAYIAKKDQEQKEYDRLLKYYNACDYDTMLIHQYLVHSLRCVGD